MIDSHVNQIRILFQQKKNKQENKQFYRQQKKCRQTFSSNQFESETN